MCNHPTRDYFYSVYTNTRICRHCWTEEKDKVNDDNGNQDKPRNQ